MPRSMKKFIPTEKFETIPELMTRIFSIMLKVVVRTFVTLEGRDERLNTLRETQSKNKGNVSKHMVGQIFFCDASIGKPKGNGQTKGNGKPKAQFMFHFSPPVR